MSENKDNQVKNMPETECHVCHRSEQETGPLKKMAPDFYVCQECFHKIYTDMMNGISGEKGKSLYFALEFGKEGELREVNRIGYADVRGITAYLNDQKRKEMEEKRRKNHLLVDFETMPRPHEILEYLNEYVVGQETAKQIMSVAVYNHYKRILADPSEEIEKSNILMIGPTGCGKTHMVRTLARFLDVPLAIADATSLTEAGYVGDDVESVLTRLLQEADNEVVKAEQGIVFIDEVDKLARKGSLFHKDVNGESVQQGLLKLLEGTILDVPVSARNANGFAPTKKVNTKNILFICGGAFPGLEDIIKNRRLEQSAIGFRVEKTDEKNGKREGAEKPTVEDLRAFGLIPEFIGRLPILCTLEKLSTESLIRVLTEPKNAILKQYQKLLEMDGAELEFSQGALRAVAERASKRQVGARALRSVMEDIMLKVMFDVPKAGNIKKVIFDGEDESDELIPQYIERESCK